MKHQQACQPWAEKIAARHPEDLSEDERRELDAHIASCHTCALVREQYDILSLRIRAAVANKEETFQEVAPVPLLAYQPSNILDNEQILKVSRRQEWKREEESQFARHVGLAFLALFLFGWVALLSRPTLSTATGSQPAASPSITIAQKPYSVVGRPTLSVKAITAILQAQHSPIADKGQLIYDLGIKYSIDPAFILILIEKDSTFGTTKRARETKSVAILRCIQHYRCLNGYLALNSWDDGIKILYQLIRNLYVDQWKITTVDEIIPRYAPAESYEQDQTQKIIAGMKRTIDAWRAGNWWYTIPLLEQR